MYPEIIKEYIRENLSGHQIQKRRRGSITRGYTQFLTLCKSHNVEIEKIFPEECGFAEITHLILNDKGPVFCHCGKLVPNTFTGAKRCSMKCRSSAKEYCDAISDTKSKLYKDDNWKVATNTKKEKTCLKKWGVRNPMQNIDIFEKQQKSCFKLDENGDQGYEGTARHLYILVITLNLWWIKTSL